MHYPPATLDDLLVLHPGLRRLRQLDAKMLRHLLNRGPGACTWCGDKILKGRREWCSDGCVEAFQSRCDPNTTRRIVIARDAGICQHCGRDTFQAEKEAKALGLDRPLVRREGEARVDFDRREHLRKLKLFGYGYARGQWREVDHCPPVVEGGGLCSIDDLRCLCGADHSEMTAALAGRRAAGRRANGVPDYA